MELERLYQLLELPVSVVRELETYGERRNHVDWDSVKEMLLHRESWEEGVKRMQESIGDDANGIKILWEMLNLACDSYERYEQRNISMQIYIDTMKFCTRFINEYYRVHGQYKFEWAWWFPRQLALQEFRIGSLEYEFIAGENEIISLHIPSDANLEQEKVIASVEAFFDFRKCHFPEWENVAIFCESWLLSPVLQELLDDNSNILHFQKLFLVENTDYDSMAVLDWVFPGYHYVSEQLPEDTSLQRKMKEYLLQGKKIGWSKGRLDESVF